MTKTATLTCDEVLAQLEAKGLESVRKRYAATWGGENLFGVKLGDLRALAKKLKAQHALGRALWATGNLDAMILATMVMAPDQLTADDFDAMLRPLTFVNLVDELTFNLTAESPVAETLSARWMDSSDALVGRAGWNLLIAKLMDKGSADMDLDALLKKIERELVAAPEHKKWAMNRFMCEVGIRLPDYTARCLALGEKLGVYADMRVAKGCTSAYAPAWIPAGIALRASRAAATRGRRPAAD
jgi:3-methyladenine DNA glycosylase AlkD